MNIVQYYVWLYGKESEGYDQVFIHNYDEFLRPKIFNNKNTRNECAQQHITFYNKENYINIYHIDLNLYASNECHGPVPTCYSIRDFNPDYDKIDIHKYNDATYIGQFLFGHKIEVPIQIEEIITKTFEERSEHKGRMWEVNFDNSPNTIMVYGDNHQLNIDNFWY